MRIYMEISNDRLQLPIAIADSAEELARIVGTTSHNVMSAAGKMAKGKRKYSRFIRVDIEEDEE